ncbi:hypothetical protein [Alishewanella sp. HL-SH05]|uniref:hypothetical protein n=1 Tax=Alishewanella sp. HL-SH05 TaxID=3461145 RepID=UPI0040410090
MAADIPTKTTSSKMRQEIGYAFLSAPTTTHHYLNIYLKDISKNALPNTLKKHSLIKLRKQLDSRWPTLTVLDAFINQHHQCKPYMSAVITLTTYDLCQLASLDRDAIEQLIYDGYITLPDSFSRTTPNKKLNVAPLFKKLTENSTQLEAPKSLFDFKDLIQAFLQSKCSLLLACLGGKLPFNYQANETLFTSIFVQEQALRKHLLQNLVDVNEQALRLQDIQQVTGLSSSTIKHAISSGLITDVAKRRFNFNKTLFLSEVKTLMKINTKQLELGLID